MSEGLPIGLVSSADPVSLEGLVVEIDPQARFARRDQVTALPAEGIDHDLVEESVALVDALLDQEIRRANIHLDGGSRQDRPSPDMRRHVHVERFRHSGDLSKFGDAAATAKVRLRDGRGAFFEDAKPSVVRDLYEYISAKH